MGSTPCVVRLPGNTKTKDNIWIDFLACSSIVPSIIPDLGTKNIEPLVHKALTKIGRSRSPDMSLGNFQTEIGGRLQGLIGIKHSDSFPEPIFNLQNGLIIFKHKLKHAYSRKRMYALRGCLATMNTYKQSIGPDFVETLIQQLETK